MVFLVRYESDENSVEPILTQCGRSLDVWTKKDLTGSVHEARLYETLSDKLRAEVTFVPKKDGLLLGGGLTLKEILKLLLNGRGMLLELPAQFQCTPEAVFCLTFRLAVNELIKSTN